MTKREFPIKIGNNKTPLSLVFQEVERLQAQLEVERPTGICEICTSTVIKENARLRGEIIRLRATLELIKSRGTDHGVEWCVATASGALESEEE